MTTPPKKIAIVSQYFYPDHASTGNLMTNMALGLIDKGCDVKVYTGYPSYWGDIQKSPKNENYGGIAINRIFHIRSDTRTKSGSIVIGFSFFLFTLLKLLFSSEKRLFFYVTTPPFLPLIGLVLKKIRDQKYVVIVHDIYPEIAVTIKYTHEGIITNIWRKVNRSVYDNADKIIVLGECMKQVIQKNYLQDSEKIRVIQNWEDADFIRPMDKSRNTFSIENNLLQKFVVTYSGNMGVNHNLEIAIEAAGLLKNSDIEFLFFGEGSQKQDLITKSKDMGLQNVAFFDFQPHSNLPLTMTCGDAVLVSQEKGTEGLCVSSKFYTALAAGKPIIAIIGENAEIAQVITKYQCGVVVTDFNPESLRNVISELSHNKDLCEKLGKNARLAFEQHFTCEIAINKYFNVIQEIDIEG